MRILREFAVAILNNDFSGFSCEEIEQVDNFLERYPFFTVPDWGDESNDLNGKCSISGQWGHTVEIEL